jgi:hypothetical protein
MAHACNPSYSGGRDQEDFGLKLAQEICAQDPISNPSQKRTGGVTQGCRWSSNLSTTKQKDLLVC